MSTPKKRGKANSRPYNKRHKRHEAQGQILQSLIQLNNSDSEERDDKVGSSMHRDKRTINENIMTRYRPLLTRDSDIRQVNQAEEFLNSNDIDCTFVGMSRALNKLNSELMTMRMKVSSYENMSQQTTIKEKNNRVMDFKLFLTQKTYNMFRMTFTMVRSCFTIKQ